MPAQGESRRSATEFGKSQEVWYWGLLRRAPAGLGAKSCDHWFFWAWRMTVSHAAYPLNSSVKEKKWMWSGMRVWNMCFFFWASPFFLLVFFIPHIYARCGQCTCYDLRRCIVKHWNRRKMRLRTIGMRKHVESVYEGFLKWGIPKTKGFNSTKIVLFWMI